MSYVLLYPFTCVMTACTDGELLLAPDPSNIARAATGVEQLDEVLLVGPWYKSRYIVGFYAGSLICESCTTSYNLRCALTITKVDNLCKMRNDFGICYILVSLETIKKFNSKIKSKNLT